VSPRPDLVPLSVYEGIENDLAGFAEIESLELEKVAALTLVSSRWPTG